MTTTATTTAVTTSNKVISETSARAQAILAKAAKAKTKVKEQATAPLLNSDEVRMSNKEIIDQAKVKEQAKATIKPATKPATTKPAKKVKEAKTPMFTCSEAMGIIMKANPNATAEQIINKADTLYIKKTGKESNLFQMGKYYSFANKFLKGYNSK